MTTHLDVIAFPGGFNLPIWAAIAQGSFVRRGLDVQLHYTGSSVEQMSGLVHGKYHIGLTGFDNIVAYQEGQGEAALETEPDLFAFMGGDDAFLSIVTAGNIGSYEHLRGKTIGVDALTTGFAFVMREMLSRNGIYESDVVFVKAGGAKQRFEALLEGTIDATLLLTPFDLLAERKGCRVLQKASSVLSAYQGIVGAASRAWAVLNEAALKSFIGGYLDGLQWLHMRGNFGAAATMLEKATPGMTPDLAKVTCQILMNTGNGFEPEARLNEAGMETVLTLRSKFGIPVKQLSDVWRYADENYYRGRT